MPMNIKDWFRHEVDGGWAWVVCGASFVIQFIVFGTIQSFGIIFISLLDEFKSGEYETAWIGSLAYGLQFFFGPITTALCEHFGCRKMVYFGAAISMIGLFASSFSTNLSTLYFTFGILWGIGASFAFFPCILVLRFYFSERISLANGVSMSGAGIGTIVMNVALNKVNQVYGWRGGLRMLCGIVALMFVCGSVYLPPPPDFYAIREWTNYKKVKFTAKLSRILDTRPWKQKAFVVYVVGISLVLFGYFVPYVHLVRFGETLRVPSSDGALLVGYMSISQIFAKLFCGRLADMKRVKRLFIVEISILGFFICNMAVTAAKGYIALLVYAVMFGFFDGLFVVVLPILICDIVGRDLMATAIGSFYGVVAIPMMLGPPISGQLYDAFNSYDVAFYAAAALMLTGGTLMYFVYRLKPDLVKTELQFPAEFDTDDMFTSNLFSCPSIHSHTVDALSGMFMSERYSMINLDRQSQITFNPLHNLNYGTKSRAASSASRQTYFPSFATDDRSEGRSEIFLQRLHGTSTATEAESHFREKELNASTSTTTADKISLHSKDITVHSAGDGFSTSTPKELSIENLLGREVGEAALVEPPSLAENHGNIIVMNKAIVPGSPGQGEQIYADKDTVIQDTASTATLVNLDNQSEFNKENEVLNVVPNETAKARGEIIPFLEVNSNNADGLQTVLFSQLYDTQLEVDTVDSLANGSGEKAVEFDSGALNIEGLHVLPVIPEGIEIADPVSQEKEEQQYNKESLMTDLPALIHGSSVALDTSDIDPTVTTSFVKIDDVSLFDELEDSGTLVPEDTDISTKTVKTEMSEPDFQQADGDDDDELVKIPPPPNIVRKNREVAPLVDLEEDNESPLETRKLDNNPIFVKTLEGENDVNVVRESDNIQTLLYNENEKELVDASPRLNQEELISPVFAQLHGEMSANYEDQDFHTPVSTQVADSTYLDLLSKRLEAVAAEQMKGELITRFPTDEMTLFAASRSMVSTPFENQGTPVTSSLPTNSSAQRTPGDVSSGVAIDVLLDLKSDGTSSMVPTSPIHSVIKDVTTSNSPLTWQQPLNTPSEGASSEGTFGILISQASDTSSQENKTQEGSQEDDIIKIPPPPDFERRRLSISEGSLLSPKKQFQMEDLQTDLVGSNFIKDTLSRLPDLEKSQKNKQGYKNFQPVLRSPDVEKEDLEITSSIEPKKDFVSPTSAQLYMDQIRNSNINGDFYSGANADCATGLPPVSSERLEDVANKELQGELVMSFPTDEMTLFAASRNMIPSPFENQGSPTTQSVASASVQFVTPANHDTNELSNAPPTTPIEKVTPNVDQVCGHPASSYTPSEVKGILEHSLFSSDMLNPENTLIGFSHGHRSSEDKIIKVPAYSDHEGSHHPSGSETQEMLHFQRLESPPDLHGDLSPTAGFSNILSQTVEDGDKKPTNPFLSPLHIPAPEVLPAHDEESHPINVPLTHDSWKRPSRKSLTMDDNSECRLSDSSNSLVNVFEIELDEDKTDPAGNNVLPKSTDQSTPFENFVGSSTNPFAAEMRQLLPLDSNNQSNGFRKIPQSTVFEASSVSNSDGDYYKQMQLDFAKPDKDHCIQDERNTDDAQQNINQSDKRVVDLETAQDANTEGCGENTGQETTTSYSWILNSAETQECMRMDDNPGDDYNVAGSQFEALDKEISNRLALIKENLDSCSEDNRVDLITDGCSGNSHEDEKSKDENISSELTDLQKIPGDLSTS